MKITDAFLGEHGAFYAQFDHLEKTLPQVASLDQVQLHAAMLASALASHARLENELLFAALERHLGPQGPLAVMRSEHEQIEGALEHIQGGIELEAARSIFLQALSLARSHFAKEEQVLFPMAGKVLDADALSRLGAQWAERRGVRVM